MPSRKVFATTGSVSRLRSNVESAVTPGARWVDRDPIDRVAAQPASLRLAAHALASIWTNPAQQSALRCIPVGTLQQSLGNRAVARLFEQAGPASAFPKLSRKSACGGDAEKEGAECRKNRQPLQRSNSDSDATGSEARVVIDEALVLRQTAVSPGPPGGPDPCADLLQQLIELLNEVAGRVREALDDRYHLYDFRPGPNPDHPDAGTWNGHRDRFYYDRDRLRQKVGEWDSNDDCRGYRLSPQEQEDLDEAREFKEKEFPDRPAPAMRQADQNTPTRTTAPSVSWDSVLKVVIALGLSVTLVATIVAALADPEPVSKLALAGLSVEEIGALMSALGLAEAA